MMSNLKKKINDYLSSDKQYPTLVALASGLFPLIHYYNQNLLRANSWMQFTVFLFLFVITPILVFNLALYIVNRLPVFRFLRAYALTGLNIFTLISLLFLVTIGLTKTYILIIGIIALALMFIIQKYIKKIVLFQLLIALISLVMFLPKCFSYFSYSDSWLQLPDTINEVRFKNKPNIYIIQPDGYTNFSEIDSHPYNYDNSDFRTYLESKDFKIYEGNRSNYFSTLTSNSSMFAMKHHYFMNAKSSGETFYDYRKGLAGSNSAIQILKNNGYKTFMILDYPYLIINRPKREYDFINYDYKRMSYIGNDWIGKEALDTMRTLIKTNSKTTNFFFIEKILPTHIENKKGKSLGVNGEHDAYLERIEESNLWLNTMVDTITELDSNALIILISDHGGYVGLESAEDVYVKNDDSELVKSIFSSLLAIKWPNNEIPDFDYKLKSNVNLFRILFSHLSKDNSYLKHLEDDSSYQIIDDDAANGVYQLINASGKTVFHKLQSD